LIINDDRIDANRLSASSPPNVTKNAQILEVHFTNPTYTVPFACVTTTNYEKVVIRIDFEAKDIRA
jgi:hypothetical protein